MKRFFGICFFLVPTTYVLDEKEENLLFMYPYQEACWIFTFAQAY